MNFELSQEQIAVQKTAREFALNELLPKVLERDEKKIWPKEQIGKLSKLGFLGMMVSPKWGGFGFDTISYTLAIQEISKVDPSAAVIMSVNNSLVCYLLEAYGSSYLKNKYLSSLASGESLGAFALSEPQSGSDASNMLTVANRSNNVYTINGTKNWVTNGINSDIILLFAITDKSAGNKGISCFLIDKKLKGVSCGKPEEKLGLRASDTSEIYFKDVKVGKEYLIGEENEGFKIALTTLNGGRIGIASQAIGIASASLESAINYSKEREQFGRKICEQQAVQFKLADMATDIEAGELLIRKSAYYKDLGKSFSHLASMAKVFSSDVAMRAANQCVQIHGGYGYIKETGVERYMRDAKITQIYEGTSEIQRLIIARGLLK